MVNVSPEPTWFCPICGVLLCCHVDDRVVSPEPQTAPAPQCPQCGTVNEASVRYEPHEGRAIAVWRCNVCEPSFEWTHDLSGSQTAPETEIRVAAQALSDFAWTAVTPDCPESAAYLNGLLRALRAALSGERPAK